MSKGAVEKLFLVLRVSAVLFLFSDPRCYFFLALCQPLSILSGSGTRFFYSGTRFLLLYGSETFFFYSQTRVATFSWLYVNLFPFSTGLAHSFSRLRPKFYFYTGLICSFSCLRPKLLFHPGIMLTFFHSLRVWFALFLLWDPIFASLRV